MINFISAHARDVFACIGVAVVLIAAMGMIGAAFSMLEDNEWSKHNDDDNINGTRLP